MARKPKLLWTGPALQDLRAIRDYISLDNPAAARSVAAALRRKVLRLREHPLSGRVVPELAALGYREVIAAPYRIVYEVQKGCVVILRVWHGRQDVGPADEG